MKIDAAKSFTGHYILTRAISSILLTNDGKITQVFCLLLAEIITVFVKRVFLQCFQLMIVKRAHGVLGLIPDRPLIAFHLCGLSLVVLTVPGAEVSPAIAA